MGGNEDIQQQTGFEVGRLVGEFAAMSRNVASMASGLASIQTDLRNVATKEDVARIETLARAAQSNAERANNRLDAMNFWKDIGKAILPTILILGVIAIVAKGAL